MPSHLTLYPETAIEVGQQVREAVLDHTAFQQPLLPCSLSKCKATCCYDGVYVGAEEREMIKILLEREEPKGTWNRYGLKDAQGDSLTVENIFMTDEHGREKTAVRKADAGELPEDFPTHFNRTRCVFLDSEGRCAFQRLAVEEGRAPWFYKPLTCWIHPIALAPPEDSATRATLTLYNNETDPHRSEDYPGFCSFTLCGKIASGEAPPAAETLSDELELLSAISERDLMKELNTPEISYGERDI